MEGRAYAVRRHAQHTQDINGFRAFGSIDEKGGGEGIINGSPGVAIVLAVGTVCRVRNKSIWVAHEFAMIKRLEERVSSGAPDVVVQTKKLFVGTGDSAKRAAFRSGSACGNSTRGCVGTKAEGRVSSGASDAVAQTKRLFVGTGGSAKRTALRSGSACGNGTRGCVGTKAEGARGISLPRPWMDSLH